MDERVYSNQFSNLNWHTLVVARPVVNPKLISFFFKPWIFPNGTVVEYSHDYFALKYLGSAMKFKIK